MKFISDLQRDYGHEWVRLLQRAAGASLYGRQGVDGDTDAVFVLKGPPRCGKSTFAECMLAVSGQYGKAMPHNLLFGDKGNPEFADAAVQGFRVLTFSEPPMNAELNTTKLKTLSGGDSLTGRLPYGREEISFQPEVSMWLSTNHPLEVNDEAVWRRMKFFNFEHTYEGADEMPGLRKAVTQDPDELKLALAWMLEGSVAWGVSGWGDTSMWSETTSDEKSKYDVKEKWRADSLEVTGSLVDTFTLSEMMSHFSSWLALNGEDAPSMPKNAVRQEMENMVKRAGELEQPHQAVFGWAAGVRLAWEKLVDSYLHYRGPVGLGRAHAVVRALYFETAHKDWVRGGRDVHVFMINGRYTDAQEFAETVSILLGQGWRLVPPDEVASWVKKTQLELAVEGFPSDETTPDAGD